MHTHINSKIVEPFYRAGFCNFTNVNLYRFRLYKEIYKHFAVGNSVISRAEIYEYGRQIGVSKCFVTDEIIGCLYAPFLIEKKFNSELLEFTYNGRLRFDEFFGNEVYFESEIPFTVRFDSELILFRRYLTSNLSQERSDQLLSQKWTRNKSKYRFQKKVKSYVDYENTISQLITESLQYGRFLNREGYIPLIREYGTNYKNSSNISCNLHSHFMVYSTMIPRYFNIYKEMLNRYTKPIDWGGLPIPFTDVLEFCSQYKPEISFEDFIRDSITDGLFRYISDDVLTFTSTGYFALTSFEGSKPLMQCFIRSRQDGKFTTHIGENTNTFPTLSQELRSQGVSHKWCNGFFEVESNDVQSVYDLFQKLYIIYKERSEGNDCQLKFGTL